MKTIKLTAKISYEGTGKARKACCKAAPLGIQEITYGSTKEEALWEMECLLSDMYNGEFTIY